MARSYGALGYVTKKSSAAEIVLAVSAVLAGKTAFETCREPRAPEELEAFNQVSRVIGSLTPQQTTELRLLGAGLLNKKNRAEERRGGTGWFRRFSSRWSREQ